MGLLSLPDSTATKRTRWITILGIPIYVFYGVAIGLGVPLLIIFGDLSPVNRLIYGVISILLLYSTVYRNIKELIKIYETGIVTSRHMKSFAISAAFGILVPLFLPIAIYNAILGIHFYRKMTST